MFNSYCVENTEVILSCVFIKAFLFLSIRTTPLSQPRSRHQHGFNSINWNSSPILDESENDITLMQRSTITTPQFCVSGLIASLPSIKTESSRLALNLFQVSFNVYMYVYVIVKTVNCSSKV